MFIGRKEDLMIFLPCLHGHHLLKHCLSQGSVLITWQMLARNLNNVIWIPQLATDLVADNGETVETNTTDNAIAISEQHILCSCDVVISTDPLYTELFQQTLTC